MLLVAFFSWWYGAGWRQVMSGFEPRLKGIADMFSVGQLLRTLFAPWRRIITYPGASLAEKWRAWGDNIVSRCVGLVVRVFVIIAGLLTLAVIAIISAVEIVVWPLLPLTVPGLFIAGLVL